MKLRGYTDFEKSSLEFCLKRIKFLRDEINTIMAIKEKIKWQPWDEAVKKQIEDNPNRGILFYTNQEIK